MPPAEVAPYPIEQPVAVLENNAVLESQYTDSEGFQLRVTLGVFLAPSTLKMALAIQFDRNPFRRTVEVQDVVIQAVLPTEFPAVESG